MKRNEEKKRTAKEARKNISAAVDRNLRILADYLERENGDPSELECIREKCVADMQCRALLEEVIRVIEETKSSFRSKKLVELRVKIQNFLAER